MKLFAFLLLMSVENKKKLKLLKLNKYVGMNTFSNN
jgi:hypothetical protein